MIYYVIKLQELSYDGCCVPTKYKQYIFIFIIYIIFIWVPTTYYLNQIMGLFLLTICT